MWEIKKPIFGDHIRVKRALYSHHGIYASEDLKTFLNGGVLEVRSFNQEELRLKRHPQDIINYAFSRVGEGGYNLISNNCEHFANDCLFGKKKSSQVDSVLAFVLGGK